MTDTMTHNERIKTIINLEDERTKLRGDLEALQRKIESYDEQINLVASSNEYNSRQTDEHVVYLNRLFRVCKHGPGGAEVGYITLYELTMNFRELK